jgi:hypothetical protein
LVEITQKGLGLLDELLPQVERGDVEWVSVLNDEEKETVIQLLGKVQGHLRQLLGQRVRTRGAARLEETTSTS